MVISINILSIDKTRQNMRGNAANGQEVMLQMVIRGHTANGHEVMLQMDMR